MFEGRHTFDAICLVAGTVLRRTKFVLAITAPSPIKCVGWCERMYVRICGGIAQQCFQHGLDYYLEVRMHALTYQVLFKLRSIVH